MARPGETVASRDYAVHAGGKGANQSMALTRAGARVAHAGALGEEGIWLREKLANAGVDVNDIHVSDGLGGHAVIQVDAQGENAIVLHGGANLEISPEQIKTVLEKYDADDILLLQNEINRIPEIMLKAQGQGMSICLNPAPMTEAVKDYPLELLDYLIVNETEGAALSEKEKDEEIAATLSERYGCVIVLTLGARGALVCADGETRRVEGVKVDGVVDTTAAGDTFVGFFLTGMIEGMTLEEAAELGCRAGAACVRNAGAMDSIPERDAI
jgi:ribokinase